jgi:uncharacterized protein (TIGR02678 family)
VADAALHDHLAAERSGAVRHLLAAPLIDAETARDEFRLVVRHERWLVGYFEQACGWSLTVDSAAGFARLAKRAPHRPVDAPAAPPRPLLRPRGDQSPFDRRRYQVLCLVCAELVRHPVTTVGLLASSITAAAALDTSRYGERTAFVDALRVLAGWGVLRVTAGELDAFVDDRKANAILTADTARLHRLLVSSTAASALPDGLSTTAATELLVDEPRYHEAAGDGATAADDARNRWARHNLARRALDEPVVYADDLTETERDYLASISGRRLLRDRLAAAGFDVEERLEGILAVDPDAIATDRRFPAPHGNAHQLALLLADRLVTVADDGIRVLATLGPSEIDAAVTDILGRFPGWARGSREGDGPRLLTEQALSLLHGFGLILRHPDGAVQALPALARYAITEPVTSHPLSLFDE